MILTLYHEVQSEFFLRIEGVHLHLVNYEVLLSYYPPRIPALLPYNSSLVFLALLTVEDNLRVERAIIAVDYQNQYQIFRPSIFLFFFESRPEIDISRRSVEESVPRLAQLARAPDCRLETHGCRQPSGGPRFKSGSADQNTSMSTIRPTLLFRVLDIDS